MSVKFLVFSDLHYKKGMYIATIRDVNTIFKRAADNKVDFIIQAGDLCNDFLGSPELLKAYLNNEYGLDVFGVYGNHELESEGNSMAFVTEKITNKANDVVWGTNDGKIGDGNIGYYYFDHKKSGLRFIFLDTNYSLNTKTGEYEHNKTASWGPPEGNIRPNSLGPAQFEWFKALLLSSAKEKISCVVAAHDGFSGIWASSPDAEEIKALYKQANEIHKNTVIMSINWHHHTNHYGVLDDVMYMDVNTVFNGRWIPKDTDHYTNETFKFTSYDENGNEIETVDRLVTSLWQSKNTHYFSEPLSAIVTISDNGEISVEGMETTWFKNVVPNTLRDGKMPKIEDYK